HGQPEGCRKGLLQRWAQRLIPQASGHDGHVNQVEQEGMVRSRVGVLTQFGPQGEVWSGQQGPFLSGIVGGRAGRPESEGQCACHKTILVIRTGGRKISRSAGKKPWVATVPAGV